MLQPCLNSKWSTLSYFRCLLLVMSLAISGSKSIRNEADQLALLDFKGSIIDDPFQAMASWNNSLHYCNWTGITCNLSNERVVSLDLRSKNLVGSIPPSIGNLTFLMGINLRSNSFRGEIPQEIGNLLHLQHLNLTWNSFTGKIPTNLTYCTELRVLAIEDNGLVGTIPDQLSSLTKLIYFGLALNNLTGGIPTWVGNFSSLWCLSVARNNIQGPIPWDLGLLPNLEILQVSSNQLSGTIPQSLFNISSISYFAVADNILHGELPLDIGVKLPNLEVLIGGLNNFTGPIPASLSNASRITILDFSGNELTGTVPSGLGNLHHLYRLNFELNALGRNGVMDMKFLDFLENCTSLQVLSLHDNSFGGELPDSIANFSAKLNVLDLGFNMMHGTVPAGLGNLVNLTRLSLDNNDFRGSIPESLGKLLRLQGLKLDGNKFSGMIPSSFGNLAMLTTLYMQNNRLEGNIPPDLGKCRSLLVLNLTGNNIIGSIPEEAAGLSSLSISLHLAHNMLNGSLPLEVGRLKNLEELDLSHNKLSGEIPSTFHTCVKLARLVIGNNLFQGAIPLLLKDLRGLEEVDLSHNNISGGIPEFLGKLPNLRKLDLSFNELEGEVPNEGIFANASAVTITGNDKLCGDLPIFNLPACSTHKNPSPNKKISSRVIVAVSVPLLVLLLCSFAAYCILRNPRKRHHATTGQQFGHSIDNDLSMAGRITYEDIFKSTNGFDEDSLVGRGSFGSVYKGHFKDKNITIAVKVLHLQQPGALRSFLDEYRALKNIRHRNLLKIINVCSGVDRQGNDFKCLVLEFMANGSLDDWLQPKNEQCHKMSVDIIQRLNIAIDVASALDYLHNHCHVPIVHGDVKPSNILLDEDMTAQIGDFGLAKLLTRSSKTNSWSNESFDALKGSIGYIPPEYGSGGCVSKLGDVYSYGIMVLELFTGTRPTDVIFKDGLNIHRYVAIALPKHVMKIVDPSLLMEQEIYSRKEDKEKQSEEKAIQPNNEYISELNESSNTEECLVSILKIGLLCSASSPRDRMPIGVALNKFHDIKDLFLQPKSKNYGVKYTKG